MSRRRPSAPPGSTSRSSVRHLCISKEVDASGFRDASRHAVRQAPQACGLPPQRTPRAALRGAPRGRVAPRHRLHIRAHAGARPWRKARGLSCRKPVATVSLEKSVAFAVYTSGPPQARRRISCTTFHSKNSVSITKWLTVPLPWPSFATNDQL